MKSQRRFFLGLLRGRIECQFCRFYLQDFIFEGWYTSCKLHQQGKSSVLSCFKGIFCNIE